MTTIVVARSLNRVIGTNGQLPWNLPGDMQHFKDVTSGGAVVMGRKTFESIGKALPNRYNVVVSSDTSLQIDGVQVVGDLQTAIDLARTHRSKVFLIGGEQIFAEALKKDLVSTIELTLVNARLSGDTYFPFTPPEKWEVSSYEVHKKSSRDEHDYAFVRYHRRLIGQSYRPLLYLPAARFDNQRTHMQDILNDGLCPFCVDFIDWYHENPVEFINQHWLLTKNDNPYTSTLHDFLLIPVEHVTTFGDLSVDAQLAFAEAIAQIEARFELKHFALGMRSGDMTRTGGSVAHLHAHIKVGDVDNPNHKPIRFKMSSVPEDNI